MPDGNDGSCIPPPPPAPSDSTAPGPCRPCVTDPSNGLVCPYTPLYFYSGVLASGNVVVVGGEYNRYTLAVFVVAVLA
jgi:hypothetical protein